MDLSMRISTDTGGTFTDLVVETEGQVNFHKSPTTPADPIVGVLNAVDVAARASGVSRQELLAQTELFLHATTRAINALVTDRAARTGFLSTEGHPDILSFREGGRPEPFNYDNPYPEPLVARALTREVPGRIGAGGEVVRELDEERVIERLGELADAGVEAIGVCLLWSVANPVHELRVGELIEEHLPGIPYTLSHQINPILREYRRACSTVIDASLKPVMSDYLSRLDEALRASGFSGRLLIVTSVGGVAEATEMAKAPIHSVGSGPAMAPVAGRAFAGVDTALDTAIIADAGGTTYDVSLVRRGRIPRTQETPLGKPGLGHITGFPSVDVKSIGAGGGSIAWVDEGGLLHLGPQSAGADPGPVAFGRGGTEPTVTDAAVTLGFLDPDYFLGGSIHLDAKAAREAIETQVAKPLGLGIGEAAAAIMSLATEHMVQAIEDITLNQGVDPRTAALVAGGGASGLNVLAVARRLGCAQVVIPEVGSTLSAVGGLMSDLSREFSSASFTSTGNFDRDEVNATIAELLRGCETFRLEAGAGEAETTIDLVADARYPHQVWDLELPVQTARFTGDEDVARLRTDFHAVHREVFAIEDPDSEVEIVNWRARVSCRLGIEGVPNVHRTEAATQAQPTVRQAHFPDHGEVDTEVWSFAALPEGKEVAGPALISSATTTVVVGPGEAVVRTGAGSLVLAAAREEEAVAVGLEQAR